MQAGNKSPAQSADQSSNACVHIVEPNGSGHRLYYVRLLAEHALSRGYRVAVELHDSCLASPEYQTHLGHLQHIVVESVTSFTLDDIAHRATTLGAGVTVIPDGDRFVYGVARGQRWNGSGRLSLLAMRERSEPRRTRLETATATALKRAALWLARRAPRVTVSVLSSSVQTGDQLGQRVADPVTLATSQAESLALRQEWAIDPKSFVYAIVGAIDDRKNAALVLKAVTDATARARHQRTTLLLAGRVTPKVREAIATAADSLPGVVDLVIVDRVLDDRRFDGAIALADCVVLAHSNDGPSGVLGKAVAAGTRVLAAGSTTLRRDCEAIGAGAHWTELDRAALATGLADVRHSAQPEPRSMPTADQFASALIGLP